MKKPFSGGLRSSIDRLLIILIGCFVVQAIYVLFSDTNLGNGPHLELFGFSASFIESGFVWTICTFPFLHSDPLLLIVNLLGLHFIGRPVERELGPRNFYWLCGLSVIFGALLWIPFHYLDPPIFALSGSTCVVLSLLTFFCFSYPEKPITLLLFFILPVTLKPKYLLMGVLVLELFGFVFLELRDQPGSTSYSSHLGGMLAGAFVYRFILSGRSFPSFVFSSKSSQGAPSKKKPVFFSTNTNSSKPSYSVDLSNQQTLQAEVDRILDKINEKGFGSLNQNEKNTLDKAKGLLNKH
jgi:membrane associated rhomboid family serine protease